MFSSRVTPDSYHSTLSLRDNLTVCFHLSGNITFRLTLRASYMHTEISDISTGLLHPHRNFGYLHGSLTPTQKFGTSPRVSYTHTQKFGISPRVSYTYTEIRDISPVTPLIPVRPDWRIRTGFRVRNHMLGLLIFFFSKLNLYLWYTNNFCNNQQSFTFTNELPPEWDPLNFYTYTKSHSLIQIHIHIHI